MPDSTPLLPCDQREPKAGDKPSLSFDKLFEKVMEDFSWTQFFQCIIASFAWFFEAQQAFINIFTDGVPTWHCTVDNASCNSSSDICKIPRSSWSWDGSAPQSFVSEWELQCVNSILTGLPASSFYMGCVLGGLALAALGDSTLGRKKLLLYSFATMSMAAVAAMFSTNVWIYSAVKFIGGLGRASITTCIIVLITEMVGTRWRGRAAIMGFFLFSLGFLSLPGIAYLSRGYSWRFLYFWTSVPALCYCVLLYFCADESPRWLLMHGCVEETTAVLRKLAAPDKANTIHTEALKSLYTMSMNNTTRTTWRSADFYTSINSLSSRRWAVERLFKTTAISLAFGMVYYGIPLGIGNLGFDIYLSVVFNALIEVPSYLISCLYIQSWRRKGSLLVLSLTSGTFNLICAVIGSQWRSIKFVLELASFFCACTAFNVLMVYSVELFPTCVRSLTQSIVKQAQVLGAAFSSLLISVTRECGFVRYSVFCLLGISSVLVTAGLPETKGAPLCDTTEEQEQRESLG